MGRNRHRWPDEGTGGTLCTPTACKEVLDHIWGLYTAPPNHLLTPRAALDFSFPDTEFTDQMIQQRR
jgi:hypothetical protein